MSGAVGGCSSIRRVVFSLVALGDFEVDPSDASCRLQLFSDGTVTVTGNNSNASATWYFTTKTSIGNDYQVRITKNSGDDNTAGDALNTWMDISATRSWTWEQTTIGTKSANITLEFAPIADQSIILRTNTANVTATVDA